MVSLIRCISDEKGITGISLKVYRAQLEPGERRAGIYAMDRMFTSRNGTPFEIRNLGSPVVFAHVEADCECVEYQRAKAPQFPLRATNCQRPFVLAFRQSYTGGAGLCGARSARRRIETTSCAVDAEGHLSAKVMVEVVTTFSSFQVP